MKMYSLIIPPELLKGLCHIREKTGKSIRKQILNATRDSIVEFRQMERQAVEEFRACGGKK